MHLQKRILVTGGSGFLGSYLCERLLTSGANVVCVDNYFTSSCVNIEHLLSQKHFEAIRYDITFPLYVEVDEIYNLACPASPIHYQRDPAQTTKTSVHGAINMLGLAKRVKAKILQASTSEVYGDPQVHPQTDDYWGHVDPIGPRSCYDEGKRCAGTLFFDYWRQHKLRIKVARIFNTYGPRMHPNDGRVISNFVVQALRGQNITICGDGSQTRSFCYVDDLIEWPDPTDGQRRCHYWFPQHGQSGRVYDPGTCNTDYRYDRLQVPHRASSVAGRRSTATATGHCACEGSARLDAQDAAQGRSRLHDRLFRQTAERPRSRSIAHRSKDLIVTCR
jgi:dTDP-D-glucose 4,6-dehydratase